MTSVPLGPTSQTSPATPMGLGCQGCEFFDFCGGTFSGFDCFSHCCNAPNECTLACPRSRSFVNVVRDAGGLSSARPWRLMQTADDLPPYIPHIDNGSTRINCLSSSYVALTNFDVVSPSAERVFSGPDDLRRHFRLSRDAHILLLSIGKDNRLEQYWQWSVARALAQKLAALGIAHVTAPNFSFALDVPRPEHLVNRMRSLKCAEQLSAVGLSVIPHTNAFNQKDWDGWRDFLREHSHITMVAQEFQTGLASRTRARWHIQQLRNIQQSLGRGLHLIAVAGRRHLPLLMGMSGVTVVDSVPFMRACKRRLLEKKTGKWVVRLTNPGEPIDDLLCRNVATYTRAVEEIIAKLRHVRPVIPGSKPVVDDIPYASDDACTMFPDTQLWLWPQASDKELDLATPMDGSRGCIS